MPPRRMNRVSWFAYAHPFVASGVAAVLSFGLARVYGAAPSWAFVTALVTAAVLLVLWWPRHGVLTRDVDDWLADDDPRVAKPGQADAP